MHLQENPTKAVPTCEEEEFGTRSASTVDFGTCSASTVDSLSFQAPPGLAAPPGLELPGAFEAPPGLGPLGNGSPMFEHQKSTVALSLADLCGPSVQAPMKPPPGLEDPWCKLTLEVAPWKKGSKASAEKRKNSESDESVQTHVDTPTRLVLAEGLLFAEVSQLKATSPMFCPTLSPATAAAAVTYANGVYANVQSNVLEQPTISLRTPLKTKLRSKADLYVPGGAAGETWQNWHMQNSFSGQSQYYSEQDGLNELLSLTGFDDCSWYAEQAW